MTIEAQLKQLVEAQAETNMLLATLVSKFDHIGAAVEAPKPVVAAAPAAVSPPPVSTPAPVTAATETTTPPVPPAAPPASAPTTAMTVEQLNEALVAEFNRLGNRDGIDAEIKKLGVSGVGELKPEQYAPLVAAVQAL